MPERCERRSPDDAVRVVVEGGFVAELECEGASEDAVRATVNDALLAWYERNREATVALEGALQRAEKLGTPTVIGQASLPEPPAWVDHAFRLMDDLGSNEPK